MGEDVADGKSSRPWAMHGQPPGRPAGPSIEYFPIAHYLYPPVPSLKIDILSIFKDELTLEGAWLSFPISNGDPWLILLKGKEGFGGFEADRLQDRILSTKSTQRFRRGRGRNFICTKNVARPRFGFLCTQRIPRGRGPILISTNVLWGPGSIRL